MRKNCERVFIILQVPNNRVYVEIPNNARRRVGKSVRLGGTEIPRYDRIGAQITISLLIAATNDKSVRSIGSDLTLWAITGVLWWHRVALGADFIAEGQRVMSVVNDFRVRLAELVFLFVVRALGDQIRETFANEGGHVSRHFRIERTDEIFTIESG